MKTKSAADTTVRLQRTIHAPLQRVYHAWTDPDVRRRWWGPEGVTTHELIFEPRVEGEFRWALSDSHGKRKSVNGHISEVVPREKIAFTWTAGEHNPHHDHSRVIVDFREARGVVLHLTHSGLHDKHARDQHAEGWNSALDKLQRLLEPARKP